ncbi:hypothetical protein C1X69_12335, partial [Pseudomonas sp. FW305-67]
VGVWLGFALRVRLGWGLAFWGFYATENGNSALVVHEISAEHYSLPIRTQHLLWTDIRSSGARQASGVYPVPIE